MKAYHIREIAENYKKDYIYIPEYDVFMSFLKDSKIGVVIDHSSTIQIAHKIVEGKKIFVPVGIVKEFDLDEKTAKKIKRNCGSSFNNSDFDGSTEGLVKLLAGEK